MPPPPNVSRSSVPGSRSAMLFVLLMVFRVSGASGAPKANNGRITKKQVNNKVLQIKCDFIFLSIFQRVNFIVFQSTCKSEALKFFSPCV